MAKKVEFLRKKHPRFFYKEVKIKLSRNKLKITPIFFIEPNLVFKPEIIINNVKIYRLERVGKRVLQNLAFHCGLAEIPSYWKATCSSKIIIKAGYLDKYQTNWWRDLIIKGMGQFFYENRINFRKTNFLNIDNAKSQSLQKLNEEKYSNVLKNIRIFSLPVFRGKLKNRYLVPVAGGRDSIVSLELLKKKKKPFAAFCVNPTREAKAVMKVAGIKNQIIVQRKIDPKLFELNKKGYLNGHTPFTSVLSFLALLCAVLFDYRHIVFSNEKSADEPNLKWLKMDINHQYSKSSEFENKFSQYSKKYLAKNIHYFSLLRKYSDLKISKMFVNYPEYFSIFSSCNRAIKLNKRWCGECPKCLFVYLSLYPFLNQQEIIKIFGEDLFSKRRLLPIMKALIDPEIPKPFECVGTKQESLKALQLSFKKIEKLDNPPFLLKYFLKRIKGLSY